MSDLYTSMGVSPRKKRFPPKSDDESVLTPKKIRTAPPTPPASVTRQGTRSDLPPSALPSHLARLYTVQTALQHALSHALATCAVSPTSDTGLVRNVLNHLSLTTYSGFKAKLELADLKRLCWLWEWDEEPLRDSKVKSAEEVGDDNPFLDVPAVAPRPKDWTRGSMGLVLSPTTHFSKNLGKRVSVYGIGIEVEMDLDKDMGSGMAAVARWTAAGETRRKEFHRKLERWIELHPEETPVPNVPEADLPPLATPEVSPLMRALEAASPKGKTPLSFPAPPGSPTSSPRKSPTKPMREFAIPFPITPSMSLKNKGTPFPQTPSRRDRGGDASSVLPGPSTPSTMRTPTTLRTSIATPSSSVPSTPISQRGRTPATTPQTPSTPRREALYDRIRQRSLSPTKLRPASSQVPGSILTRDQLLRMGQEEMRRRCLLGRLGGVAEGVWMLFSTPIASTSTPASRKRRALPTSEIAQAIMKSSPVPISIADVKESLEMLTKLCPFFLKKLKIANEEWMEMPASNPVLEDGGERMGERAVPRSPGSRGLHESSEEVLTRSPRRVRKEVGGLREVREMIRKELEIAD